MSTVNQIKILDKVSHEYLVTDIGAKAENIEFDNGSNLEDKFINFAGATSETAGTSGLVPAPAIADRAKFLKADGTWADPAGGVTSVNNQTGAVVLGASDVGAIASTAKGAASGVAELDANGKVPAAQLPSFVDDVIEGYYNTIDGKFYEESTYTTEITPESGKIYIDLPTNKTYRWGGSAYAEIPESLALGETSSTAYRGDRGKTAYDHATDASKLSTAQSSGLYKIATTAEGHIASVTAVQKSDITSLGIPAQDTTYESKTAAQGGTDVSLVTTGEKYIWNQSASAGGSFASLSDVEIVNPTYGELIMYDSVKQKFVNQNNGSIKLLPWSSATDEQIISIINAYYDGIFTLADIQSVWSIGDVRTMNISAIATSGTYNNNTWSVGESHRAQTVKVEILEFNHDILTTPINNIAKALVTVDLKDCLMAAGIDDTNGSSNSEHGYMNSSNTNAGGWTSSARRKWCNGGFYQAIPETLRSIIKPVNKLTSAGNQSSTINTDSDYIFLLSEIEIFGSVSQSKSGEGSQYAWFANTQANRYKSPHWNSSSVSDFWWERSPYGSYSTPFCIVDSTGSANNYSASIACGLAPAWAF